MGRVVRIKSKEDWERTLKEHAGQAIVVDFTASWCGPCRMIAPEFDKYSADFPTAVFVKVDVDENESVAASCGITAMPTFQVWRDGKKVGELIGASKDKLKALIQEHATSVARGEPVLTGTS